MHLKVSNLRKSYDKLVLDGVSYDFYKGKIYAVLGRNGAGKTTFFNCLNKDVSYEEGTVSLVEAGLERELEFDDIGLVSASPVLQALFAFGVLFARSNVLELVVPPAISLAVMAVIFVITLRVAPKTFRLRTETVSFASRKKAQRQTAASG